MVLFKKGKWTLETSGLEIVNNEPQPQRTVLHHRCYPDSYNSTAAIGARTSTHCWNCGVIIPDELIALWKLQNWEVL